MSALARNDYMYGGMYYGIASTTTSNRMTVEEYEEKWRQHQMLLQHGYTVDDRGLYHDPRRAEVRSRSQDHEIRVLQAELTSRLKQHDDKEISDKKKLDDLIAHYYHKSHD